jgi:hypothetical protein
MFDVNVVMWMLLVCPQVVYVEEGTPFSSCYVGHGTVDATDGSTCR